MKPVRLFALLTLVLLGSAAVASAGLFTRGSVAKSARAYAVLADIKPSGDRLVAHVELRDLDSNRFIAAVNGYVAVDVPLVCQVSPSLTVELTVRETGNHSIRYLVEVTGFAPEFRYEGTVNIP